MTQRNRRSGVTRAAPVCGDEPITASWSSGLGRAARDMAIIRMVRKIKKEKV
jgi:hypothetical protein